MYCTFNRILPLLVAVVLSQEWHRERLHQTRTALPLLDTGKLKHWLKRIWTKSATHIENNPIFLHGFVYYHYRIIKLCQILWVDSWYLPKSFPVFTLLWLHLALTSKITGLISWFDSRINFCKSEMILHSLENYHVVERFAMMSKCFCCIIFPSRCSLSLPVFPTNI